MTASDVREIASQAKMEVGVDEETNTLIIYTRLKVAKGIAWEYGWKERESEEGIILETKVLAVDQRS